MDLPVPDFAKIDAEMARLDEMEEQAEQAEEAAMAALQAARAKRSRLNKQKKMLKRREQKWFDASAQYVADLDVLEGREGLNYDVTALEGGLMPGSLGLDLSSYAPPSEDPEFVDTAVTAGGNS